MDGRIGGLVFIEPGRKFSTGLADVHFTIRARNSVNPSLTAGIRWDIRLHVSNVYTFRLV